jgi:hypothetical protein
MATRDTSGALFATDGHAFVIYGEIVLGYWLICLSNLVSLFLLVGLRMQGKVTDAMRHK